MAGYGKGFGGFGGGNQMQQLMKQAQKMQEQMQKAQEEIMAFFPLALFPFNSNSL